jgi:hypothetical protein
VLPHGCRYRKERVLMTFSASHHTELVKAGRRLLASLDAEFPCGPSAARPTIAELEQMLASNRTGSVEIKPDGSICVLPREEIESFRAILNSGSNVRRARTKASGIETEGHQSGPEASPQ